MLGLMADVWLNAGIGQRYSVADPVRPLAIGHGVTAALAHSNNVPSISEMAWVLESRSGTHARSQGSVVEGGSVVLAEPEHAVIHSGSHVVGREERTAVTVSAFAPGHRCPDQVASSRST